jgi:hypothetical protein
LEFEDHLDQSEPSTVFDTPDIMSPLHKYSLDWLKHFFASPLFNEESDMVLARDKLIEGFWKNGTDDLDQGVTSQFHKEDGFNVRLFLFELRTG